jgi:MoaA/NifB/PqqE/SkfB family radical SAM enzyme
LAEKSKVKYDAWLHWHITNRCNMECEYCFSVPHKPDNDIASIDTNKLLETLSKTNKTFRIGFTGGEPFLVPNFVEAASKITEDHFLSINTNLTLPAVADFAEKINPDKVLFIHASFHFTELQKKNLLEKYTYYFHLLKEKNFNIYAEEVAYPPHLERLEKDAERLKRLGINLRFGAYYGFIGDKRYPESYTEEEINRFNLPRSEIEKFSQKNVLCNAGYNVGVVFSKGQIKPCFQIHENLGNIYESINFNDKLIKCPAEYCGCPMNLYDLKLYKKALNNFGKSFDNR